MARLRTCIAISLAAWLLLSTGAAFAIAALEAEHRHEHQAAAADVDTDHQHADLGVELFSKLFGQPGFDQLTSGCITAHLQARSQPAVSEPTVCLGADARAFSPVPPPGPPPRIDATLLRGGISN